MTNKTRLTFQQVICSAPSVRGAFKVHPALSGWWQIVLFLHGKPRDPEMPDDERLHCVADGFRFYACLYRALAIIFIALAGLLAALKGMGSEEISAYWVGASCLGGIYLWLVSGLGYYGVEAYKEQSQSVSLLVSFMVMIVAFLSLFIAALSAVAHYRAWVGNGLNLMAMAALFVFGVGSYLIEVIYLTTEGSRRRIDPIN